MKTLCSLLLLTSMIGCAANDTPSDTAAICPTANAPTYASFGKPFMTKYCTTCHSAEATKRYDAPPGLDFDTEAQVRTHAVAIDRVAGAGPKAKNMVMPVLDEPAANIVAPSDADRQQLAQMLACMKSP